MLCFVTADIMLHVMLLHQSSPKLYFSHASMKHLGHKVFLLLAGSANR